MKFKKGDRVLYKGLTGIVDWVNGHGTFADVTLKVCCDTKDLIIIMNTPEYLRRRIEELEIQIARLKESCQES